MKAETICSCGHARDSHYRDKLVMLGTACAIDSCRCLAFSARCRHTPCPDGYVERAEWAEKKGKTHEQKRCPACGLWAIWERRTA